MWWINYIACNDVLFDQCLIDHTAKEMIDEEMIPYFQDLALLKIHHYDHLTPIAKKYLHHKYFLLNHFILKELIVSCLLVAIPMLHLKRLHKNDFLNGSYKTNILFTDSFLVLKSI